MLWLWLGGQTSSASGYKTTAGLPADNFLDRNRKSGPELVATGKNINLKNKNAEIQESQ
jgi:hypothetical protein